METSFLLPRRNQVTTYRDLRHVNKAPPQSPGISNKRCVVALDAVLINIFVLICAQLDGDAFSS